MSVLDLLNEEPENVGPSGPPVFFGRFSHPNGQDWKAIQEADPTVNMGRPYLTRRDQLFVLSPEAVFCLVDSFRLYVEKEKGTSKVLSYTWDKDEATDKQKLEVHAAALVYDPADSSYFVAIFDGGGAKLEFFFSANDLKEAPELTKLPVRLRRVGRVSIKQGKKGGVVYAIPSLVEVEDIATIEGFREACNLSLQDGGLEAALTVLASRKEKRFPA